MFPQLDLSAIRDALEDCSGDPDVAVAMLLSSSTLPLLPSPLLPTPLTSTPPPLFPLCPASPQHEHRTLTQLVRPLYWPQTPTSSRRHRQHRSLSTGAQGQGQGHGGPFSR